MTSQRKPSIPGWARRGQAGWTNVGQERPSYALEPGPGQESVWDYPRPPRLVPDRRSVLVRRGDLVIARSNRTLRLLETASPPTFYLPPEDVDDSRVEEARGSSRCEWKGEARYFDVVLPGERLESVGWAYPAPFAPYEELADYLSFYPAALECFVDDERVLPQPGGFYGGWVTADVCGPFKGEPGTGGW